MTQEELKMRFIKNGKTMGDESTPYIVTDYKAKTVNEFVYEVLENKKEWGYIGVKTNPVGFFFAHPNCEYRYGNLLNSLPNKLLSMEIEHIEACGGWTRMDYMIIPKK